MQLIDNRIAGIILIFIIFVLWKGLEEADIDLIEKKERK